MPSDALDHINVLMCTIRSSVAFYRPGQFLSFHFSILFLVISPLSFCFYGVRSLSVSRSLSLWLIILRSLRSLQEFARALILALFVLLLSLFVVVMHVKLYNPKAAKTSLMISGTECNDLAPCLSPIARGMKELDEKCPTNYNGRNETRSILTK